LPLLINKNKKDKKDLMQELIKADEVSILKRTDT
jgi:hypothetical protein